MCENAEVGKEMERTRASYTQSVLQAQYVQRRPGRYEKVAEIGT